MGVVAFDKYSTGRRRRDYQENLADQERLRERLMESVRTIFAGYVEFLLLIIKYFMISNNFQFKIGILTLKFKKYSNIYYKSINLSLNFLEIKKYFKNGK
jgi:hypothetical protein